MHVLTGLSRQAGIEIFIKRDDLTGLAMGGNKTRKLEYLIQDAMAQRADTLITAGAAQSNHCRQTAAAAVKAGLACELVLAGEQNSRNGNVLLDTLLGAKVHWTPRKERQARMQTIAHELEQRGQVPYVIPVGGSNAVGALGYVNAMIELEKQCQSISWWPTHVVLATSSGGTMAGLVTGKKLTGFPAEIVGISIDKGFDEFPIFENEMAEISLSAAHQIGLDSPFHADDFIVTREFLGLGYGIVGAEERNAIYTLARSDAILLDPVYTGKAMYGLLELIGNGFFNPDDRILFWHTGGEASLFGYESELMHAR
ncbi:pyridoxal-phosphate dependent enzyme [candidate division KSB1 bacterium]|jgi:D-cysteine desulfhydrase|nr:pyridoxal-phosphate dependent enzyme [candidate division KSB1 bacterium]